MWTDLLFGLCIGAVFELDIVFVIGGWCRVWVLMVGVVGNSVVSLCGAIG